MDTLMTITQDALIAYGPKVFAAAILLLLGRWAAQAVRAVVNKIMIRKNLDTTVAGFTCNLVYIGILVFIVIAALGQLGIQTTSFIAIIGAAGLAISLSLQGSLANFAAGFLLVALRPFKVGDFIEGAGVMGKVEEIQLFSTRLTTGDNKLIIIPNSNLTGGNITNYSAKDTRRVDLSIGVGYEDDLKKTRKVLENILTQDSRVHDDPAPFIAVSELADSSVNFTVRAWVNAADYWNVYFDSTEKIKQRFDEEGISIPYPQRDVHLQQQNEAA